MKVPKFLATALLLCIPLLVSSCDNSEKKDSQVTSKEDRETSLTSRDSDADIALEQQADYTRLYALGDSCKMTAEETASIYEVPVSNVKETYSAVNGQGGYDCTYHVTLEDGTKTVFSLSTFQMSKEEVQAQLRKLTTGSYDKDFISTSEAGDNYIWKHPNQGYYVLYNPNFANGLQVRYRMVFKLSETQRNYLEKKGKEAIEYLIDNYKN
ncbi:hypothetical protein [Altibacter lentus]|uniref:hypothetical protein n=1 Tax=Altibacter lentus TaxID=1223410 RepID=UPI000553B3D4|nr:hypothetical protein [Altibacter lentus]